MEKLKTAAAFPFISRYFFSAWAGLFGKLVELPAMTITLGRVGFSSLALLLYLWEPGRVYVSILPSACCG